MLKRTAILATLALIPLSAIGAPKVKGSIKLQVVTTSTRIHGSFTTHSFAYTDLLYTQMNGKKIVFECVQRGDICPMVESGQTYTADQNGDYVRITMNTPEDKKAIAVKFKQVGSW